LGVVVWVERVAVSGNHAYVTVTAYSCGDDACDPSASRLHVIDITDPRNPQRVGGYDTRTQWARDVAVSGNYAYVAGGYPGLQVIGVSDPANPQRIGGYGSSGKSTGVAVSGNYAYVTLTTGYSCGDNGACYPSASQLDVIDISDFSNPRSVGSYEPTEWARQVAVSGNYAYLIFDRSLEVIDVSDPGNPQRVGGYDVSGFSISAAVSGNYAYVTSGSWWGGGTNYIGGGFEVIDVSNPANPHRVGGYGTNGPWDGAVVAVLGNHAFVAHGWGGLQVIDVSNPANPQRVGGYDTGGAVVDVVVSGNYAYVAGLRDYVSGGLEVVDVSNPANPQRVGGYTNVVYPADLAVSGSYAYVADIYAGLQVIDVSDPGNPRRVGGNTAFEARAVTVANGKLFVAAGSQGWFVLNLFQPPNSCPSAQNQNVFTPEDAPLAITLGADRDGDGEPALYSISQLPVYGALTLAGNTATYTPAANYFGPDSFKFTVTDGHADCAPREYAVNISVACMNDPPVAEVSFALDECLLRFPGQAEPFIISLNGADAPVALNATATDVAPDCAAFGENLAYAWTDENGAVLGNGPGLAGRLGLGCHTVTLTVSDGTDQTAVPTSFCVITPGGAVDQCVALVDSADIENKRPLIATLKAAMASFDRGNHASAVGQLRAFQNKVQAQIAPQHPEAAQLFLGYIEDLLNATTCMAAVSAEP
jgi:hypothetical protein